jgi:glutamate racemase
MKKTKIGIIDSGKGGYETLKNLKKEFPEYLFISYFDRKNAPYGTKSKKELLKILKYIIKKFEKQKIKYLIFACNTASTLIPILQKSTNIKLISIIDAVKYHIISNNISFNDKCLIFATEFTIKQNTYQTLFKNNDTIFDNKLIDNIQNYKNNYDFSLLNTLLNKEYDILLLGCTHLTIIKNEIQCFVSAKTIIDTSLVFNNYLKNIMNL